MRAQTFVLLAAGMLLAGSARAGEPDAKVEDVISQIAARRAEKKAAATAQNERVQTRSVEAGGSGGSGDSGTTVRIGGGTGASGWAGSAPAGATIRK